MADADPKDVLCQFDDAIKNERGLRQYLSSQNFPPALQDFLIEDVKKAPLRYFVCDDSGSMQENDGSKFDTGTNAISTCTRWSELSSTIKFQLNVSNKGLINSKFLFLNGGTLNVGKTELAESEYDDYFRLTGGRTPLCKTLNTIIDEIKPLADHYRQNRKSIIIVISTDGEASDGDVRVPLQELKSLPVTIILRLCTSEDAVVDYWNAIDKDLELKLDVVDDYISEAKEMNKTNKWLTYGPPMHRAREFGLISNEIDKLDEVRTDNDSVIRIARIIFGADNVPEGRDLTNDQIADLNKRFDFKVLNPLTGKQEHWIKSCAMVEPAGCGCTIS